jgi:hypothetical protein
MAFYKISISLRSIQDTITWLSKKWFVSNVNVLDFVGEIGGTIEKTWKKNNPSFHLSGSSYFTRFHWYGLLIVVVLKFGHPNAQFSPKDNDGYFASPGLVSEELLGGAIVAIRVDLQPHQSSGASWPRHALWPKPGSLGPEMRLVSKWFPLISRSSKI